MTDIKFPCTEMMTSIAAPCASLPRAKFPGQSITSRPHTNLASPCRANRRRFYRGGRFADDVSPYLDLVADVLAGVESAYAAAQQPRDGPYSTNENTERGNRGQEFTDTTASSGPSSNEDASPREASWRASDVMQAVPVDIEEHADGYTLYMDVPGLQKADVKIQIFPSQRKMAISGERSRITKEETDPSGRPYRRRLERRMGKFSRSLNLAKDLDIKSVTARVDHGVLIVTAKKLAPQEPEAMEVDIE